MKVCPVCKSRLFDDMDTCYGCMHRFENDSSSVISEGAGIRHEGRLRECGSLLENVEEGREDAIQKSMSPCGDMRKGTWSTRFDLSSKFGQDSAPLACVLTVEIMPAADDSCDAVASGETRAVNFSQEASGIP